MSHKVVVKLSAGLWSHGKALPGVGMYCQTRIHFHVSPLSREVLYNMVADVDLISTTCAVAVSRREKQITVQPLLNRVPYMIKHGGKVLIAAHFRGLLLFLETC